MLNTFLNVAYVLIAIAMTVLILLQRGAGAAAGSGFGGGASATVFGARGSANFLSKSTAILATLFFVISLGMAMLASHRANEAPSTDDLGVMGQFEEVPAAEPAVPALPSNGELPQAEPAAAQPASAEDPVEAASDEAPQAEESEAADK
ncbi:preprotein translocase subunit SecG [Pseudomarimonas arenosa]|uniref:Protein-export membrane protein SecG n=1 Tax=Pseudomarimonas arenosa TaxID=2774145 RepID=A0AAW3ZMS6_9GAMM|nr:preprotein translocase subunit SecG [Pseudomarimonas arenosa]MBD8526834.1 preprotein translocase subunit SecG [Pseudomarimonas arenosa]